MCTSWPTSRQPSPQLTATSCRRCAGGYDDCGAAEGGADASQAGAGVQQAAAGHFQAGGGEDGEEPAPVLPAGAAEEHQEGAGLGEGRQGGAAAKVPRAVGGCGGA